ncbi:MAG: PHP domain-containing protein [Candidatus Lokiarchaeota archaeon]|nr:PHP domain-containing protein [Candidatus Lokiarchaeota archaeon]
MSVRNFLKQNRAFSIVSTGFCAWIVFLVILSIINQRKIVFLDVLDSYPGTDVSSEYNSSVPLIRYFVEPLAGIAFIFGKDFEYLIAFTIIYLIYRIVYLYLKKEGAIDSEFFKKLRHPAYNFMNFVFKIFSITVVIIGVVILMGYLISGYYFVSRYFMVIVQMGIRICFVLLIIKFSYFIIILLHPKLHFKQFPKKKHSKNKGFSRISERYDGVKIELIYLVGMICLLLGFNILLISTPFPTQKINANLESDEFLFDFHIHTTMSDGWITPEQRVMWYIEQGIDGAAFTDHDNIRGALIAQNYVESNNLDFVVWLGAEWTDNERDIHMNYYGLGEEIVAPMSKTSLGISFALNASDMIAYVKNKGGYVIVNHYNYDPNPLGGFGVPYTLEQLRDWGVDGFEIVNGDDIEAVEIREFCLNNTNSYNESLICLGSSDIETNRELDAFVKLKLEDPSNKTIDSVFKNLRGNNHSVITINLHSSLVKFPGVLNTLGFELLEDYLNYILNLNSFQILSWIAWSFINYILIFLTYRKIKKQI